MKKSASLAVIVTVINRVDLLRRCLQALDAQTYRDFCVYVVANGSDSSVEKMLADEFPAVHVLSFRQLLGSAGAYKVGLQRAKDDGAQWFWLMDDDVQPDPNALQELVKISKLNNSSTFGSVNLDEKNSGQLCWYNDILVNGTSKQIKRYDEMPDQPIIESTGIGYMGLFLPAAVLDKVGYPNDRLFIWADDVDYSIRIRRAGFRQLFVRRSLVYHPKGNYREFNILGKRGYVVTGKPWREYYQIRNTIYVWSVHNGRAKTLLIALPKQVILWMYVLFKFEDRKWERFWVYLRAFLDGATGRLGMTIKPDY